MTPTCIAPPVFVSTKPVANPLSATSDSFTHRDRHLQLGGQLQRRRQQRLSQLRLWGRTGGHRLRPPPTIATTPRPGGPVGIDLGHGDGERAASTPTGLGHLPARSRRRHRLHRAPRDVSRFPDNGLERGPAQRHLRAPHAPSPRASTSGWPLRRRRQQHHRQLGLRRSR